MAKNDGHCVYTALNEVLAFWQSGRAGPIEPADEQRLQQLISSSTLEALWERISLNTKNNDTETATKLLLIELFEAARSIPAWEAKTGSQRKARLKQIDKAAQRLNDLLSDSPIYYLSEEAIDEMRLAVSPLSAGLGIRWRWVGEPDFAIALADLQDQVEVHRAAAPVLRRPGHEDAHRRYFVVRIQRYLRCRIGTRSNRLIAELARIMLRDDEIDTEVVRKTLS